jgi:uncharacterized protein YecE (DUF72 family)
MSYKLTKGAKSTDERSMISPSILIGVGGWAYFPLKYGNKLEICSKIYDFVEVNSTFYKLPPVDQARKWRASVPTSFEFTMRASMELTHEGHLEPTKKNYEIHEKELAIAKELEAAILHFQFPPTLEVTHDVLKNWKDFMGSTKTNSRSSSGKLAFAFEIRNSKSAESLPVKSFLREYDIIPTTDASRSSQLDVSSHSKILYTRVFGLGDHTKWSFDSNELLSLDAKVQQVAASKKYVTFHNMTMYEDAARMRNIVEEGRDQDQKGPIGLDSLKRIIMLGRLRYPVSKKSLLERFAWRTFNLETNKRIHIGDVLQNLPDRKYESVEEIIKNLEQVDGSIVSGAHALL